MPATSIGLWCGARRSRCLYLHGELHRDKQIHPTWRYNQRNMPTCDGNWPVRQNQVFQKNVFEAFEMPTACQNRSLLALVVEIFKFKICMYVAFQAIFRKDPADDILAKFTRIAITSQHFFQSERSSRALNSRRRWHRKISRRTTHSSKHGDRLKLVKYPKSANWIRNNSRIKFTCSIVAVHVYR